MASLVPGYAAGHINECSLFHSALNLLSHTYWLNKYRPNTFPVMKVLAVLSEELIEVRVSRFEGTVPGMQLCPRFLVIWVQGYRRLRRVCTLLLVPTVRLADTSSHHRSVEALPELRKSIHGLLACERGSPAAPKLQDLHETGQRQDVLEESQRGSSIDSVAEARGLKPDQ